MNEETKIIEFMEVCQACKGTGIYVGMGERDGAGIVCYKCKGTGCYFFRHTYVPFRRRAERTDVTIVLQRNPGICVGWGDSEYKCNDFGGMTYEDWSNGEPFPPKSEMRKFVCPAWWYQSVDYEKKPSWDECLGCGAFPSCEHFVTKAECWERWDREYSKGGNE